MFLGLTDGEFALIIMFATFVGAPTLLAIYRMVFDFCTAKDENSSTSQVTVQHEMAQPVSSSNP